MVVLLIIAYRVNVYGIVLRRSYKKDYSEYVEKYSKEYDVDPLLVYSIIKAESNFNERAISTSGAIGLMQLMESTAKEVAVKEKMDYIEGETLLDAQSNIKIGIIYYKNLLTMYKGNTLLALTAYNAGIGNVENWISQGIIRKDGSDIENIPYKETNMYVRRIMKNYRIYTKI